MLPVLFVCVVVLRLVSAVFCLLSFVSPLGIFAFCRVSCNSLSYVALQVLLKACSVCGMFAKLLRRLLHLPHLHLHLPLPLLLSRKRAFPRFHCKRILPYVSVFVVCCSFVDASRFRSFLHSVFDLLETFYLPAFFDVCLFRSRSGFCCNIHFLAFFYLCLFPSSGFGFLSVMCLLVFDDFVSGLFLSPSSCAVWDVIFLPSLPTCLVNPSHLAFEPHFINFTNFVRVLLSVFAGDSWRGRQSLLVGFQPRQTRPNKSEFPLPVCEPHAALLNTQVNFSSAEESNIHPLKLWPPGRRICACVFRINANSYVFCTVASASTSSLALNALDADSATQTVVAASDAASLLAFSLALS